VALTPASWAGELGYRLQSPLVGGYNASLQAAENARSNAVKQAKDKAIADAERIIREAEDAAANTPAARFVSSLQSQIYFAVSQKIATTALGGGSGSFTTADSTVQYSTSVDGKTLTITIITPSGTSVMALPTGI